MQSQNSHRESEEQGSRSISSPSPSPLTSPPYATPIQRVPRAMTTGEYSPSSWPFPKQQLSSSRYLTEEEAVATVRQREICSDDPMDKNGAMSIRPSQKAWYPTTGARSLPDIHGSIMQSYIFESSVAGVLSDPFVSNTVAAGAEENLIKDENPEATSLNSTAKNSLLAPVANVPERPESPTPYSSADEPSPGDPRRGSEKDADQMPKLHPARSDMRIKTAIANQKGVRVYSTCDMDVPGRVDHSTSAYLDSHLHNTSFETTSDYMTGDDKGNNDEEYIIVNRLASELTEHMPSGERGLAAEAAAQETQGIILLGPAATSMEMLGDSRALTRNSSRSWRPTICPGTPLPDIGSIRRGPTIRHNRMTPIATRCMTTDDAYPMTGSNKGTGRPANIALILTLTSAVLLQLAIVALVASVTVCAMDRSMNKPVGQGALVGTALSIVLIVIFVAGFVVGVTRFRKLGKRSSVGGAWIEMQHRARKLPPRPSADNSEPEQENAATAAWKKFTDNHALLRNYVEGLENVIGTLKEHHESSSRQPNHAIDSALVADVGQRRRKGTATDDITAVAQGGGMMTDITCSQTKGAKKGVSMSQRHLLYGEETLATSDSWQTLGSKLAVPLSNTKTSILTELCDAVVEPYSPLSNGCNSETGRVPSGAAISGTRNVKPENDSLSGPAVPSKCKTHRRGVPSIEIFNGGIKDS
ncbi:hypothetical protein B0T26DRAFT_397897 [Lasiosphaeria miniovina]|uniref:Uncharacterized protein n=1 Tax=Lasiosphaeria miniovina TaxID=1954250 RepID=A0AA40A4J0_9PEZI|nr:uncharacterized protein B0T26DRAFT_397897 [Lasiosphaeria miniovina]KAK0709193.1 hypothetical protein B0T26DRAFT_397897 [Lasiosphaeria miniovina]